MAASPPIPRVGCASVTRQGSVPPPKRMWDRLATRLPCHSLLIIYVPYARYYATSWLRVCMRVIFHYATTWLRVCMGQGVRGRRAHLVLALHPTGSYCAESPAPYFSPCTDRGSRFKNDLALPRSVTASLFRSILSILSCLYRQTSVAGNRVTV